MALNNEPKLGIKLEIANAQDFTSTVKKKLQDLSAAFNVEGKKLNKALNIENSITRAGYKLDELKKKLKDSAYNQLRGQLDEINKMPLDLKPAAIKEWNLNLKNATNTQMSFGKVLASNIEKFSLWTIASTLVMQAVRSLKQMISTVIELDKTWTSLQMATNATNAEMTRLRNTYTSMAKELKTSITAVSQAAETWLKMGYAINEANKAAEAAIIFAKTSGQATDEASKQLQTAMKAYGLEIENLIEIADKLTTVDLATASSASSLANGLAEVASVANNLGISMDRVLAIIGEVETVTGQTGSEIGNMLQFLLARMQKVKLGEYLDDEGEAISDVEKILASLDIQLRDSSGNFRNFQTVLDEIGASWGTYSSLTKSAIADALGGARRINSVITMFDNYDEIIRLTNESLESSGTTMERYNVYADSMEARLEKLKATFQDLAQTTINSDFVKNLVNIATGLMEITNYTGGLVPLLFEVYGALKLIKALKVAKEAGNIADAFKTMFSGGWIGAILVAIGAITQLVGAIKSARQAAEEARQERIAQAQEDIKSVKELRDAYIELYNAEDKVAAEKDIADKWKELTELANNYGIAVENASQDYLDYLKLAQKVESAAMEEELVETRGEYEGAKKFLESGYQFKGFFDKSYTEESAELGRQLGLTLYGNYRGATPEEALNTLSDVRKQIMSTAMQKRIDISENAWWRDFEKRYSDLQKKIKESKQTIETYELNELKKQYADIYGSIYTDALDKFQDYKNGEIEISKQTAKETLTALQEQINQAKEQFPELTDYIDKEFKEIVEGYTNIINQDIISPIIKAQIKNVKDLQKAYEDQNEALKKQEKLQEKILAVQEAQKKLREAEAKKIRVYREGQGFVYESDISATEGAKTDLEKAQQELADYKKELSFQTEIDELTALSDAFEKLFKNSEDFKDFVNSLGEDAKNLGNTTEEVLASIKNIVDSYGLGNLITEAQGAEGATKSQIESGIGYFETHHSGGVAGDGTSFTGGALKDNEILAKLTKGEFVLNTKGKRNLLNNIVNNNGSSSVVNVGNITLPGVSNANQFIEQLKSIGRMSYQTTNKLS